MVICIKLCLRDTQGSSAYWCLVFSCVTIREVEDEVSEK